MKDSKILLLESAQEKTVSQFPSCWTNKPYSNRVVALAPYSVDLFRKLKVWPSVENIRIKNVTSMQVSCKHIIYF